VLANAGCADPCSIADMRALTPAALIAGSSTVAALQAGWVPSIDGQLMTTSVLQAFFTGTQVKVPVLVGANHAEYRMIDAASELRTGTAITAGTYVDALTAIFQNATLASQLAAVYPVGNYATPGLATATAAGDTIFSCPMRTAVRQLSSTTTVYSYEFDDQT